MQSVPPAVMRRIMRELTDLKKSPPEGIRVVTSDEDILDVTGLIQGPEGTPYEGGYFRVKFKFTEEFPAAPPKCWFATKIFHPNVAPSSGEICVNTLKKDWKSSYGIGHILVTVKCLLIYPNPESALDEEAGKLLLENYESYCSRARLITSVHATPKVKPAEFDSPATVNTSTSVPSIPVFSVLPTTTPKPSTTSTTTSQKSASPAPQPLKSSASNQSLETPSNSKERHTSPSPLSTADANVNGGGKTVSSTNSGATKAVKRSAVGGAASGAEKRKKALKRL